MLSFLKATKTIAYVYCKVYRAEKLNAFSLGLLILN